MHQHTFLKNDKDWDDWLAQLVEYTTLDFEVMSSSPTMGTEIA